MLKERLISAAVGIVLFLAVVFSKAAVMNIAVALIIILALFELYSTLGFTKNKKELIAVSLIIPVCFAFGKLLGTALFMFMLCLYMTLLLAIVVLRHDKIKMGDAAQAFFITAVVCVSFVHIAMLRQQEHGLVLLWPVFVGAWTTDAFAYIFGSLFGKHPLAPQISPKKTVEGAIAGVLGSLFCMVIYGACVIFFVPNASVNWLSIAILGALCGVVAQIGDLAASAIKREANIKDFGNILPGHGGVMDRFDSVMLVAPVVFYFISIFPIVEWF